MHAKKPQSTFIWNYHAAGSATAAHGKGGKMKAPHRKKMLTAEKQQIYDTLLNDKFINSLCMDCIKAGAQQVSIICLVDYCYQLGREQGWTAGRKYGFKQACDEMERVIDERNKNKKDPG